MDTSALEAAFKRLQKAVHPDFYGGASQQEQDASASASSALNVAYRTLRNPATRAQYLLQLRGMDAIGEGAGSRHVSPALLMQVMEARETVEDASTPLEQLRSLLARTAAAMEACVTDLGAAFRADDVERAQAITVALQYYSKLRAEAEEAVAAREHQQLKAQQQGKARGS